MTYIRNFPEDSAFRQTVQGPGKSDAATKDELAKQLAEARKSKAATDESFTIDTSALDGVPPDVHDIPKL